MDLLPYGDQAVLVNFEQTIKLEVNQQVMDLYQTLQQVKLQGLTFLIPAYCSLVVGYDPSSTSFNQLRKSLLNLEIQESTASADRLLHIPVCYEKPYALDMDKVVAFTDLEAKEIIRLHTAQPFHVFMLGFQPGFAYMGPLPSTLQCPRKDIPRTQVPARSVGLAGNQTGIYPDIAPGGWQIIGQTPIPTYRWHQENPFLISAGDKVHFKAIDQDQHLEIEKQIEQGSFDWESIYEA